MEENPRGRSDPGHFAMVMGTAVVSVSAYEQGMTGIARGLLLIGAAAYVFLWIFTLERLLRDRRAMAADLAEHARGPGFFTLVAATGVLGSAMLVVGGSPRAADALWWLGLVLWVTVTYSFFAAIVVRREKT